MIECDIHKKYFLKYSNVSTVGVRQWELYFYDSGDILKIGEMFYKEAQTLPCAYIVSGTGLCYIYISEGVFGKYELTNFQNVGSVIGEYLCADQSGSDIYYKRRVGDGRDALFSVDGEMVGYGNKILTLESGNYLTSDPSPYTGYTKLHMYSQEGRLLNSCEIELGAGLVFMREVDGMIYISCRRRPLVLISANMSVFREFYLGGEKCSSIGDYQGNLVRHTVSDMIKEGNILSFLRTYPGDSRNYYGDVISVDCSTEEVIMRNKEVLFEAFLLNGSQCIVNDGERLVVH